MTTLKDQTSARNIIKDGITKSIYDEDVSFEDIADYFRIRMSYVSIEIPDKVLTLETSDEIAYAKLNVFENLVGLLEIVSNMWNNTGGIDPPASSDASEDPEYKTNGQTYH